MPDNTPAQQRQNLIMFTVGIGLIGFLVIVFILDAERNGFEVNSSLVTSITMLIMFLLGGDVVRKQFQ